MKRNRVLLFGLFTFALVCASLTFVGSTYAKYTSEIDAGTQTIQAAKYAWTVNDVADNNGSVADEFKFEATKLAPGYGETITLTVENESDVTLKFTFTHSFDVIFVGDASLELQNPVAYKYAIDTVVDAEDVAETSTKADLNEFKEFTLKEGESAVITLTLDWAWVDTLEQNTIDTKVGRLADKATWTVAYKLLAEQIEDDPATLA
ncbi:MAG: hypothetical protein IJD76_05965 [Bacilli bacterium]|nr:hypothetical protein [Bacilli bacterium]